MVKIKILKHIILFSTFDIILKWIAMHITVTYAKNLLSARYILVWDIILVDINCVNIHLDKKAFPIT